MHSYQVKDEVIMTQLIVTMIFILVSSLLLATQNQVANSEETIKCEMQGKEHRVYQFDPRKNKYSLSLLEKGRPKTSLSRQIQQIKPVQNYPSYKEYFFKIDDHNHVLIKMDQNSNSGRGELIQTKSPSRVKEFSKCERMI